MQTLTDKRCHSSLKKLFEQMEALYFRAFGAKVSPSDDFHREVMELDKQMSVRLNVRPLGQMEIDQACKIAYSAFNAACKKERERIGLKEVFQPPPPSLKLEPVEFGPWRRSTS